jgi:hypothetical protein
MRRTLLLVAASTIALTVSGQAQAPQAPPKPGAELKRLAYFVGTWKTEGEDKPGPMGPGGKSTSTDKFEWMPGGFFLLLHSDGTGPMGPGHGLGVFGYDTNSKVYTYHGFDSMGQAVASTGTVTGDTWSWKSEEKVGATTTSVRVTVKELSPTVYTFKLEMSQNGGAWATAAESKSTKVTP